MANSFMLDVFLICQEICVHQSQHAPKIDEADGCSVTGMLLRSVWELLGFDPPTFGFCSIADAAKQQKQTRGMVTGTENAVIYIENWKKYYSNKSYFVKCICMGLIPLTYIMYIIQCNIFSCCK